MTAGNEAKELLIAIELCAHTQYAKAYISSPRPPSAISKTDVYIHERRTEI